MNSYMKRCNIIYTLFFLFVSSYAVDTPKSVMKFYNGLKTLEETNDPNIANETTLGMISCFSASEESGIEVKLDGMETMSSNKYSQKLHILIFQQKALKTKCTVVRTELAEQPDLSSSMQRRGAQHYISYITKQYTLNGRTVKYNDVVETLISNGSIVDMKNSDENNDESTVSIPSETLNTEQLRARAAFYYTKGKHVEAYSYYEKLVKQAPKDGDAYYRLALMTLWRKGCKKRFSRDEAKTLGIKYLDNAILYGNNEIKEKAENVKNNREHQNVYF